MVEAIQRPAAIAFGDLVASTLLQFATQVNPTFLNINERFIYHPAMTLEDLRVFATVCDVESMSEAARLLGRTQAAIAQHIRKLERELNSRLFSRNPRGVTLTMSGRVLYDGVSGALGSLATAAAGVPQVSHRGR